MYVCHMYDDYPQKSEDGVGAFATGSMGRSYLVPRFWEPNQGPVARATSVLTAEPALSNHPPGAQ